MKLYQSSLPAVFTAVLVRYTTASSLLETLLKSLLDSLPESLLEGASHQEKYSFPQEAFWPMENFVFAEALADGWL